MYRVACLAVADMAGALQSKGLSVCGLSKSTHMHSLYLPGRTHAAHRSHVYAATCASLCLPLHHQHQGGGLGQTTRLSPLFQPGVAGDGPCSSSSRRWSGTTAAKGGDGIQKAKTGKPKKFKNIQGPGPLLEPWRDFMRALYGRGYFTDGNLTSEETAVKDPRAVKKAIQALGRRRSDLIWKLPPGPLNELADSRCPHPACNIRKNVASFERIKDYAGLEAARSRVPEEGLGPNAASTQDVLRVVWSWVQANPVSEEIMTLSRQVMDLILAAELEPLDEELAALSKELCATPDLETFDKLYGEGRDPSVISNRQKKLRDAMVTRFRKKLEKQGRSEADTDKVQGLLEALVGKVPVGENDWFCGQCSAFNFAGVKQCKECGAARGAEVLVVSKWDLSIQEANGATLMTSPARRGSKQGPERSWQKAGPSWSRSASDSRPSAAYGAGDRGGGREGGVMFDTWRPEGSSGNSSSSSSRSRQDREGGSSFSAPREARPSLFSRGSRSSRDEEGGQQKWQPRPRPERSAAAAEQSRDSSSSSRAAAAEEDWDASAGVSGQEAAAGRGQRRDWDGEFDEGDPAEARLASMSRGSGSGGRGGGRSSGGGGGGRGQSQSRWQQRGRQGR